MTAERKKVADEKKRLEEAKAQVGTLSSFPYLLKFVIISRWEHGRLQGCVVEQAGQNRSTIRQDFFMSSTCVLYLPSSSKCVCLNTMIL